MDDGARLPGRVRARGQLALGLDPALILFVAPFIDVRRPWRMLHLDLLVLAGFSVALAFFNAAKVGISSPLVVRRSLPPRPHAPHRLVARGPREPCAGRSRCSCPCPGWRSRRLPARLPDRAERHGLQRHRRRLRGRHRRRSPRARQALYGDFPSDNEHGDTYGPVNYLAYVPFEAVMPWSGTWDDLPAAHGAALVFDLAVCCCSSSSDGASGGRGRGWSSPTRGRRSRSRSSWRTRTPTTRSPSPSCSEPCSRGGTRSDEGSSSRSRG